MPTIKPVDPARASGTTKQLFEAVERKLGVIPNMIRLLANSPAALNAYLGFSGALSEGSLPAKLQEQIAITVADNNDCAYCLSAHTALGKLAGLDGEELTAAQRGQAKDGKTTAALRFATKMVRNRGQLSPSDVETLKAAGFDDAQVAEVIAAVALNIFTNYFNNIVQPEIDFPAVKTSQAIAS